jgi:hypothetical protein
MEFRVESTHRARRETIRRQYILVARYRLARTKVRCLEIILPVLSARRRKVGWAFSLSFGPRGAAFDPVRILSCPPNVATIGRDRPRRVSRALKASVLLTAGVCPRIEEAKREALPALALAL